VNETQRFLVVGITLSVAVGGLAVAVAYLRGNLNESHTTDYRVRFDDARGIQSGYQVRMAGIPIGSVQDVVLVGKRAELRLRVDDRYSIPGDSRFTIVTPLIGSTPYIQVLPGDSAERLDAGRVREGESSPGLDTLMGKADSMMGKADSLVGDVGEVIGDERVQEDLRKTVHNLRLASDELPKTLRQIDAVIGNAAELSRQTTRILPGLEKQVDRLATRTETLLTEFQRLAKAATGVAEEADGLAGDLRGTVGDNRETIRKLLENANETVVAVSNAATKLSETLTSDAFRNNLNSTMESVAAASRNMVTIAERLDQTAGQIQKLTADPALSADLKATVSNIRETSESVRDVAGKIAKMRLPGERRPESAIPESRPAPPSLTEPGLTFDGRYGTTAERFRTDIHFATTPSRTGEFFRFGLTDATESSRLNVQKGVFRGGSSVRYGLFAGKWGIGFDAPVLGWDVRLDAYDPNRATTDVRLKKRIGTDFSVLLGLDSFGNGNRPMVGVQIKR